MNCRQFGILAVPAAASLSAQAPQRAEYHLVVVGGTGGGFACAIRAAREGLRVLLVNYSQHVGGMVSGGIGVMDTLHVGKRAPVYDELSARIPDYYRGTYGENSPRRQMAKPGDRLEHPNPKRLEVRF